MSVAPPYTRTTENNATVPASAFAVNATGAYVTMMVTPNQYRMRYGTAARVDAFSLKFVAA